MVYRISSLDLKALLNEIADLLQGSFIRNIYQKGEAFLFKLWTKEGKKHFLIESGKRLNLTNVIETGIATDFAKAIRRHLRGKKITDVRQYKLDRILEIRVDDRYTLLTEFFNRGNFLLVKEEQIILAQKHQHMKDRDLYPGKRYEYPPQSPENPLQTDIDKFISQIRKAKDLVRGLVNIFGPKFAEEICIRVGINKNFPTEKLKKSDFQNLLETISNLLRKIENERHPQLYYDEKGYPQHYTPIPFKSLATASTESFPSFSEAIDQFYIKRNQKEQGSTRLQRVNRKKEELKIRMKRQKKKIKAFKNKKKEYSTEAKEIYNHLREIKLILEEIKRAKRQKDLSWERISQLIQEKYKDNKIERIHPDGNVTMNIGNRRVTLNIFETPQEQAERLFKKTKKVKRRIKSAQKELEKTKKKLQEIEEKGKEIEKEEKIIVKMPNRNWFEHYRWFKSSEGFLVLAGKNAKTNEKLIKTQMKEGDLFLHAEVQGGAATLIKKKEKEEIPKTTIKEAAIFAGSFSKAWEEGFAGVDVYYTPAEKVSLSPPSGEYLPKGGFMVKEKRYIKNVSLKTAVAVKITDEGRDVVSIREVGGPIQAVSRSTTLYTVLKPGTISRGKIAKRVKRDLIQKAGTKKERKAIKQLKKEKFLRFIPSKSRIVKS